MSWKFTTIFKVHKIRTQAWVELEAGDRGKNRVQNSELLIVVYLDRS